MVKMTFSSENKQKSDFDFPKLSLDHGERARVVMIDAEPEMMFIHTLRAPEIINGEVVMEKVKAKDGSLSDKPKYNFIGRHICFGNIETLLKNGKDPEQCPTCAAAQQSDAIEAPVPRYATHVVRYKTQPGGFKIQTPFQAELLVWAFTAGRFNSLVDIAEEHGDLRKKDLLLGPCENKMYQNFDIQVGGTAEWLADEERNSFVKRLYAENKLEDLMPAIGRKISREMANDDIQKVLIRHAQAFGGSASESAAESNIAGGMDLDNLLGGGDSTPASAPTPVQDEPLGVTEQSDTPPWTPDAEAAPVQESSTPEPEKPKQTLDFDSLLDGL